MAYDGALKFDTKVDQSGFVSGVSQLKSTALAAIGAIGGAFATGAIAKALIGQIGLVEQYGSAINDQSQKIGITTQAYQELNYIMGQVGGNVDMLQMGIKTLSSAVVDGNKAFEQLGISLDEARAMSQEDLFNKVVEQLASMESGTLRTSLATDLFGRSASELAPLLNMGADGIAKMRQEAQTYGLVMTEEAVAATDRFGDAQALAQKSGEALRNAMIGKMMPALTDIALGFADIAKASTEAFNARGISGVVDVITDKFPLATAAVSGLVSAFTALLVIKALTPMLFALQTAQLQLTLALMGTKAAALAASGSLTLTEVIVGIFTGQLKGATASTALFNATLAANPILAIVTAIGLLVGGVVLLSKNFDRLNPTIAETREEIQSLDKAIKESESTYADSSDSIERQKFELDGIVEKLDEASKGYKGSSIEQAKMRSMCDSLSSSVDGLSVTFDTQTGALSMNTSQMYKAIDAQYDLAKANAASARYQELVTAQLNAQFAVYKAKTDYDKFLVKGAKFDPLAKDAAFINLRNAMKLETQTTTDVNAFAGFAEIGKVAEESTQSLNALKEAERGVADEMERIVIGGYSFSKDFFESVGISSDNAAARLDTFTAAATNLFGRINTETKLTLPEIIANLEANRIAIEDWGDNIVYLGSKLPKDLLQPLIDAGPEEMAGVIALMAGASDTELANLAAAFGNGGEEAKEAWLLSLGAGMEEENPLLGVLDGATEAAAESGTQFGQALITSINNQNYSGAASSLTSAFRSSFQTMGALFSTFLERVHFDLGYAIGGVKIDLVSLAQEVKSAFGKIPTQITVHVNVVYSSSGGVGGAGGASGGSGGVPTGAMGGVYAPITVQGVVQSDTQLANTITRNFGEVMYGRNS